MVDLLLVPTDSLLFHVWFMLQIQMSYLNGPVRGLGIKDGTSQQAAKLWCQVWGAAVLFLVFCGA